MDLFDFKLLKAVVQTVQIEWVLYVLIAFCSFVSGVLFACYL